MTNLSNRRAVLRPVDKMIEEGLVVFFEDAPIQLRIIDTEEQIGKLLPFLDTMVEECLVATSAVEVIRYSRSIVVPEVGP